jgi:hypothetical protein
MSEPNIPVIVGEVEAGRAATVRRAVNKLIKGVNTNTFDLAELLYEMKEKQYYSPEFESFSKYARSLDLKYTKSYYLVKIVSLMLGVALARPVYEPVGLGKLRVISKLNLEGEYEGVPMPLIIKELTEKAGGMSLEDVTFEVNTILGLTEDESMVWLNILCKKLARENCIKPALAKAKMFMGQTKDDEGEYHDASDGSALEMVCANFLADPNFENPNETVESEKPDNLSSADAAEGSSEA